MIAQRRPLVVVGGGAEVDVAGEVVGLAEIRAELRRVGRVVDAGEELDLRGQPLANDFMKKR